MLEIRLFGPGQAAYFGQPIAGFPNQQSCLLFCYLILNRHTPQRREHLAAAFWGDYPTNLARKSLRNAIWRLRQAFQMVGASLEDYLVIAEDTVSVSDQSDLWLDIEQFESGVQCNQDLPANELVPEQILCLETATNLYLGDLLEGTYEDWCLYDRERLRQTYLNALTKLMVYHGHHGNYERGLGYGQRILALDNLQEKIHRQIMWIDWIAGNREAALEQYRLCSKVLREELGIHPMKETQSLYETILHSQIQPERQSHISIGNVLDEGFLSTPSSTTEVLQKLRLLQRIVEQTNTELHLLERMIQKALANSG